MKKQNKDRIRIITEIIAFVAFIFLSVQGRIQIWLLIFGGFVAISFILGRMYCGWICPIETFLRPIVWSKKKLNIRSAKTPIILRNSWFRWLVLVSVLAIMLFSRMTGIQINFILFILGAAVVLTLFFEENFWHRFLCPYGTILSITSRFSIFRMRVDKSKCISCGKCSEVCPSYAAQKKNNEDKYTIEKKECLTCFRCQNVCPTKAINYTKKIKNN